MYYIYIIQNIESHKFYVGQTSRLKQRWYAHKYELENKKHHNDYLQNAWNSHGGTAFEFFILDTYETKEEVDNAEIFYKAWFESIGACYNIKPAGDGKGKVSEETKRKMSLSQLGRKLSEERKKQISERMLNRNEEEKRISLAKLQNGRKMELYKTKEFSEKCKAAFRNKSEDAKRRWRDKISNTLKGKTVSIEHRRNAALTKQKSVRQYNLQGTLIEIWNSITEAAKSVDGHPDAMKLAVRTRNGLYKKYKWEIDAHTKGKLNGN